MKVFCDKYNMDKNLFLANNSDISKVSDKIELYFEKDLVYLINNTYKDSAKIIIDFNDRKFIQKNDLRLKDKNDIFWKIFSRERSTILDGTAGFGRDGYLLDSMNHEVTMVEYSTIVSILLKNALQRSDNNSIKFFHGNTYDFIKYSSRRYDYIYLDFMFNKLKNNSLSSKNDETLKLVSFTNNDKNKIIKLAQKKANKKVVVKEPSNSSSYLSKPNHTIKTKLLTYNIYLGCNA